MLRFLALSRAVFRSSVFSSVVVFTGLPLNGLFKTDPVTETYNKLVKLFDIWDQRVVKYVLD